MANRNGSKLAVFPPGGFRVWEDSENSRDSDNRPDLVTGKPKRLPLQPLKASRVATKQGKLSSTICQPIIYQSQTTQQSTVGLNFSIFCDEVVKPTTSDCLAGQVDENKFTGVNSRCSSDLLSSDLRSGNSQNFGDLSLDKENIPEDSPLPDKLFAAPSRLLADRLPLGPLKFDCSADESFEESHDEIVCEQDGRPISPTNSSDNDSFASSHQFFTPRSQLEKECHADLIYGCPEYADSIYAYLRDREVEMRPKYYYMGKQKDINEAMRAILVDWLLDVAIEYTLDEETYHLTIAYIDRFLSLMSVTRTKLQLVGTAAMFIAAKFEEIYPPDVKEFVYITDDSYTKSQVARMERLILDTLNFEMSVPTVLGFLTIFCKALKTDRQTTFLAEYLCELALLDVSYLRFLPSQIAASALCLANITVGDVPWSESIEITSGYSVSSFYDCMVVMLETFRRAPDAPQQSAREKFSNAKYFQVALLSPPLVLPPAE